VRKKRQERATPVRLSWLAFPMPTPVDIFTLLRHLRDGLDGDVSLEALAGRAGWSPFHLHRQFRQLVGETPKAYTQRLRLDRAAARLATSDDRVVDIALECGFASHEVFSRAFRRRFGHSPERHRRMARATAAPDAWLRHADLAVSSGPCLTLYRISLDTRRTDMSTPTVSRKDLQPQPALVVRSRVARSEIATTIAEGLGKVFAHMAATGSTLAGRPFSRYLSAGPGLLTMEVGVPIAAAGTSGGEVEAVTLPGGPSAFAVHMGPYDRLQETYAAIERWMESAGVRAGGAPWESYITDPAELPNPADWQTDVYWPIGS
jgi:AraC family transcriptional regulator